MRRIYILPNLFTAASLFCGLLAIFEMIEPEGDLVHACQLVFLAGIFDVMDGMIARLTRTESPFGLYFDSLSDAISFGAAPAMIVASAILPSYPLLGKATCGLFAVCAALRLARFNLQASKEEKKAFTGLPSPGGALAAVSAFWVLETRPGLAEFIPPAKALAPVMVVLAYLMVSKIPYYGVKSFRLLARQPFEILVSIVIVLSLLVAMKEHIELVMLAGFGAYALSGPAMHFLLPRRAQTARAGAAAAHDARHAGRENLP